MLFEPVTGIPNKSRNKVSKYTYISNDLVPRVLSYSFPGTRERETLVWAGHVSSRFQQITNKRFAGGADKWGIRVYVVHWRA